MSQPTPSETYVQIARALPRPSPAQCDRFVQHVAVAQRWVQFLPADGGVPCVVFLNPHAGQQPTRDDAGQVAFRDDDQPATAQYHAAFGYLDYCISLARSPSGPTDGDLSLFQCGDYTIRDADGRTVALPPELLALATCSLNATIHPNMVMLLESLTQRAAAPLRQPAAASLQTDVELRTFVAEYVREELAGFQCPDDQAAWEIRQLQAFQQLYAPRHAEQIARLRRVLSAMVSWIYDR